MDVKHSSKEIAEAIKPAVSIIQDLHVQALEAEQRDFPQENYLLAKNLFELHYGDKWKKEMSKIRIVRLFVCMTDLVLHIMNET